MRKINYKSDFELLVTWVGEDAITPFSLKFEVGGRQFVASYDGEDWKKCKQVDDKHILVVFDSHRFGCGTLCCELTYYLSDESYADGTKKITVPVETGIVLVQGVSDDEVVDLSMEIFPNYKQGPKGESAYDVAVKNGFEGSEEEWLQSLRANITLEGDNILVIDGKKFTLTPYEQTEE